MKRYDDFTDLLKETRDKLSKLNKVNDGECRVLHNRRDHSVTFALGFGWSENKTANKMRDVLAKAKIDPRRLPAVAFQMAATIEGNQVVEETFN